MPLIDVQHPDPALHGREAVLFRKQKRFRKAKHGLVRLFGVSIVEDHIIGKRERNLPDSVQVIAVSLYISLIESGKVDQASKGHVPVHGTLVLVQVQGIANDKRNIILYPEKYCVLQSRDGKRFRVFIVCSVECVVQIQKIPSVLKGKAEQAVLVFPVDRLFR